MIALVLLITGGCAGFDSTKSSTVPPDPNKEKYQTELKPYCSDCIVYDIYQYKNDEILIAFAPKSWKIDNKKDLEGVGYYLFDYVPSKNTYYAVTYNIAIRHPEIPNVDSVWGSKKYVELTEAYSAHLHSYQVDPKGGIFFCFIIFGMVLLHPIIKAVDPKVIDCLLSVVELSFSESVIGQWLFLTYSPNTSQ